MTPLYELVCIQCGRRQAKDVSKEFTMMAAPGYCQEPCVGPLQWKLQK